VFWNDSRKKGLIKVTTSHAGYVRLMCSVNLYTYIKMASSVSSAVQSCIVRKNDVIYTPIPLAKSIIDMCEITSDMKVLDPCYGGGAFYDNLPECNKSFCEIEMGKDFFDETERYDLIIGNPPYSKLKPWLEHTIKLTDKFCYVFGVFNMSPPRFLELEKHGFRITKMLLVKVEYFLSTSFVCICEKNKPGIIQFAPTIYCDVCGKRCNRGAPGYSFNECSPKEKKQRKKG
jgi:hypothetical protein